MIPEHLSYSQSHDLLGGCSWKFFLARGQEVPQKPLWAGLGGSAVHEATEIYDHRLRAGEDMGERDLFDAFHARLDENIREQEANTTYPQSEWTATGRASREWPDKEDERWWRTNGLPMVASWRSWRLNSVGWDIFEVPLPESDMPMIEWAFDGWLGGARVIGKIDRVFHVKPPQGKPWVCVVDLKSGSRTPVETEQLGTYAHFVRELYRSSGWGEPPTIYGAYWMARKGNIPEIIDLSSWTKERLDWFYARALKRRTEEDFVPVQSNMCGTCTVHDFCIQVDGERANEVPTPWGLSAQHV